MGESVRLERSPTIVTPDEPGAPEGAPTPLATPLAAPSLLPPAPQSGPSPGMAAIGEVDLSPSQLVPDLAPPRVALPLEQVEGAVARVRVIVHGPAPELDAPVADAPPSRSPDGERAPPPVQHGRIEIRGGDRGAVAGGGPVAEGAAQLQRSNKWSLFGKVFQAASLAVALTLAVLSGGVLPIALAAVGLAVYLLDMSGLMDKAFDHFNLSQDTRMAIKFCLNLTLLATGGFSAISSIVSAASAGAGSAASILSSVSSTFSSIRTGNSLNSSLADKQILKAEQQARRAAQDQLAAEQQAHTGLQAGHAAVLRQLQEMQDQLDRVKLERNRLRDELAERDA